MLFCEPNSVEIKKPPSLRKSGRYIP